MNTGWSGGAYGVGSRIKLAHTRAIVTAILSGQLDKAPMQRDDVFGIDVVTKVPGVPDNILIPRNAWADKAAFDATQAKLAQLFVDNFKTWFADVTSEGLLAAAPKVPVHA